MFETNEAVVMVVHHFGTTCSVCTVSWKEDQRYKEFNMRNVPGTSSIFTKYPTNEMMKGIFLKITFQQQTHEWRLLEKWIKVKQNYRYLSKICWFPAPGCQRSRMLPDYNCATEIERVYDK
ncbi:hypothetical protein M514_24915 [Trichuris suis]|uniref:Uncharacterized protein n=1 Tax=Trichuris suis TaxID=68888 RepID=A0A085N079_9BILA|nr:hypothetical protein M514_24915 [Trichuris suis]